MSIISAIVNFWPITFEDLLAPAHDLDIEVGDVVEYPAGEGWVAWGKVLEVTDADSFGKVWVKVSHAAYGNIPNAGQWFTADTLELLNKNAAA